MLQDYLSLEVHNHFTDNSWKQIVYDYYKKQIVSDYYKPGVKGRRRNHYASAWGKITRIGIDKYGIEDMDSSILVSVIGYSPLSKELGINSSLRRYLVPLQRGRNEAGHSDEHESFSELYTAGLYDLEKISAFLEKSCELSKSPKENLAKYKQKYIKEIEQIKHELFDAYRKDTSPDSNQLTHDSWSRMKLRHPVDCPLCRGVNTMTLSRGGTYRCINCGYSMSRWKRMHSVLWFCDGCDTFLNVQPGFEKHGKRWTCTLCGYDNDVSRNNID